MRAFAAAIVLGAALVISSAQAAEPGVTVTVTPVAFSPNGDGIREMVRVRAEVSEPGELTVSVWRGSALIATLGSETFTSSGGTIIPWTGRRTDGKSFPDGPYTVRAKLSAAAAVTSSASATVLLDTTPPALSVPRLSSVRLRHGRLTVYVHAADLEPRIRVRLLLYDEDGERVGTGPRAVVPTGRVRRGWRAVSREVPGAYRLVVSASDGLGNTAVSRERPLLVEHAVHPHVWARFRGVGRHIALTFDDCNFPGAWSSILHTLRRFHVHATFFCPGQRVAAEPALARRTVADGNAVGSHGWDHADFPRLSYGAQLGRLEQDRDVWWRVASAAATPFFRPPYGAYNGATIAAAGRAGYAAVVLWDVDPRDWSSPGVRAIIDRVVGRTHPGSIVLMHVVPETATALPTIVSRLKARRLRPATLPQLARMGRPSPGGWPIRGTGH